MINCRFMMAPPTLPSGGRSEKARKRKQSIFTPAALRRTSESLMILGIPLSRVYEIVGALG
jgi:hypothetical protein